MDDDKRARLRKKLKELKEKRTGGEAAPTQHATQEKAIMDAFGEDPQAFRMAHSLLQNKEEVLKNLSKSMAAASLPPPKEALSDDEEGLPPCKS